VAVIEDTAAAPFSRRDDRPAGTFGELGCFSFQATKTVTTGEGGFVLTSRRDLWERMRLIRDHGMRPGKRYWHDVVGHNFRLTNLQAALGCAQLERLPAILRARETMVQRYRERLSGLEGVTMQRFEPQVRPAVWAVVVKVDPRRFGGDRDWLIRNLMDKGIETRPGFYPFSAMPLYKAPRLAVSEAVGPNVISLPSFPALTEAQIDHVCDRFRSLMK
jgi:perosamine synthetase